MARVCVVTADPAIPGGMRAKLIAFLLYAESRGHLCDVYYAAERADGAQVLERLRAIRSLARLERIEVPVQLPHFLRAEIFAHRFRPRERYDAHQLVSAWTHLGVAFARRRVRFAAWIAGTSTAELGAMARTRLRHWYFYNAYTLASLARQESRVGRSAALVLADSRYSCANVQRHLGLEPASLQVLPNPVDLERFRPGAPVREPRRYVVSVSRLMRGKGFETLLRAFRKVVDRLGDVELRIAGDGPERANLEALRAALRLEKHVVFAGELAGDALIESYRGASLFALASHQEGLPTVVLEAMACALPVVCTDCGGPIDHVVEGETGFLTPVGDVTALAERMLQILAADSLAERMGARARERALRTFSPEAIFAALDEVYARIFGVQPGERPAA